MISHFLQKAPHNNSILNFVFVSIICLTITLSLNEAVNSFLFLYFINQIIFTIFNRFTWNFIAYHYMNAQNIFLSTLEEKHGDVHFDNVTLHLKYYYPNIAKVIDAIDCDKIQLPASISIQSGSWDLGYSNLRNMLQNPSFIPAFLKSIINLSFKPCAPLIRIIFMHTM